MDSSFSLHIISIVTSLPSIQARFHTSSRKIFEAVPRLDIRTSKEIRG